MNCNQTFFVDIGETMMGRKTPTVNDSNADHQTLFCKCGHIQTFNYTIKKEWFRNCT